MDLKFEQGILKLLRKIYVNSDLDIRANALISKNLSMLFNALVKDMKDSTTEPKVEDIQKVTAKLLPPNLKKYAICEAQKEVFMAQTFSFDFVPKSSLTLHESELLYIEAEKKKDKELLQSNFISGVNSVLKDTFPSHKFDKSGSQEIATYLVELSEFMTRRLKKSKSKQATAEDLQKVVQDSFPESLAEHAKSEAHRMLFDFENKRFTYLPEKYKHILANRPVTDSARKEMRDENEKRKRNDEQRKDFKNGIIAIMEQIHDNTSINPTALKMLTEELYNLRYSFMDRLRQGEEPKTVEQVQEIVSALLPPLMSEHAIAEGQKLVRRYETGEFDFEFSSTISKKEEVKKIKSKKEIIKDIPSIKGVLETGVTSIAKVTQPKTDLHKTAVSIVGEELDDLCTILIKTILSTATRDIAIVDIQTAAKDVMPENLLEHAIAEGEKMIRLYEMKGIKFTPKKKKTRELSVFE